MSLHIDCEICSEVWKKVSTYSGRTVFCCLNETYIWSKSCKYVKSYEFFKLECYDFLKQASYRVATPKLKIKIQSFFRDFSECFSVFFRVSQGKIQSFVGLLACAVK